MPHWDKPVVVARHGFGDQYRAQDFTFPGAGTITISWTPEGGGEPISREVIKTKGSGIAMGMFNLDSSIEGFARACFTYALGRNYPVYLSSKNTILKVYDGTFKNTFQRVYDTEFKPQFEPKGLTYEHRLIDDMVASNLKWSGGYLWACKNYDGDVQSDTVAQGYGSLGLMTSVLMSPDGKSVEAEAAHGTVTRHYRMHQQGKPTSTNPIASIYAWTRGLQYRGRFDGTPDVVAFAEKLEKVCVDVVESGRMTKDLAILIRPDHPYLTTEEFLTAIDTELRRPDVAPAGFCSSLRPAPHAPAAAIPTTIATSMLLARSRSGSSSERSAIAVVSQPDAMPAIHAARNPRRRYNSTTIAAARPMPADEHQRRQDRLPDRLRQPRRRRSRRRGSR